MRSLFTLIWSSAHPGLTRPGLGCIAGVALVGLVSLIQESAPLRRLGLRFAWDSGRDAMVAAMLICAAIDSYRWMGARSRWELRSSTSSLFHTVQRTLAGFLTLGCVGLGSAAALITLERILVPSGARGEWLGCLGQGLAMAAPIAAWTPAAAHIAELTRLPCAVLWAILTLVSCGVLRTGMPLPLDRLPSLGDGGGPWWAGVLPACLLSTAAGLCASAAVIEVHLPRATACGSASSATSTATSKR